MVQTSSRKRSIPARAPRTSSWAIPMGPVSSAPFLRAKMAAAAASEDPRFRAIEARDVGDLEISISILDPPRRLSDPTRIDVGREGLVVKMGWNRGTLLPKVAVEHGWDAETFLRHTCLKAGLPPTAWREPGCEVEAFEAEEFGEVQEA